MWRRKFVSPPLNVRQPVPVDCNDLSSIRSRIRESKISAPVIIMLPEEQEINA